MSTQLAKGVSLENGLELVSPDGKRFKIAYIKGRLAILTSTPDITVVIPVKKYSLGFLNTSTPVNGNTAYISVEVEGKNQGLHHSVEVTVGNSSTGTKTDPIFQPPKMIVRANETMNGTVDISFYSPWRTTSSMGKLRGDFPPSGTRQFA